MNTIMTHVMSHINSGMWKKYNSIFFTLHLNNMSHDYSHAFNCKRKKTICRQTGRPTEFRVSHEFYWMDGFTIHNSQFMCAHVIIWELHGSHKYKSDPIRSPKIFFFKFFVKSKRFWIFCRIYLIQPEFRLDPNFWASKSVQIQWIQIKSNFRFIRQFSNYSCTPLIHANVLKISHNICICIIMYIGT